MSNKALLFSFHAIKNITCAEDGLVATDNNALDKKLRCLKFHGLSTDAFDRQIKGRQPQDEVIKPGFKYNLSDIHASIAVVQLKKLAQINKRRAELVDYYRQKLSKAVVKNVRCP